MLNGKLIKRPVELQVPGTHLQYGYHGCHRVSVQVFHKASGHGPESPLVDVSCGCSEWGQGELDVFIDVLVRLCQGQLAAGKGGAA
jgi:hypothetical protein